MDIATIVNAYRKLSKAWEIDPMGDRYREANDALDDAIAAALEGKAQTVEAFEIHNRFCGENGEPCQVCRLKAEREKKK